MSKEHPYISSNNVFPKVSDFVHGKAKTLRSLEKLIKQCPKDAIKELYEYIIVSFAFFGDLEPEHLKRLDLIRRKYLEIHPSVGSMHKPIKDVIKESKRKNTEILQNNLRQINKFSFNSGELKFLIYSIAGIIFIILLIFQYIQESKCESVTWYEYGVKKTARVCNEEGKRLLQDNIEVTKELNE